MKHLEPFSPRAIIPLPRLSQNNWQLKRYAILAHGREFAEEVAISASREAFGRLPKAGKLTDEDGNHGIGFQIIHFAETAVVSPVFYWQWGSVLAHIDPLRASWTHPTRFGDGRLEVLGCIWEMEIVSFEVMAWKQTMLVDIGEPEDSAVNYLHMQAGVHH